MKECSVKYALSRLSGKWKLYIIWVLTQENTIRFNELQRRVGNISAIMLSRNLQELERDNIIIRRQYDEIPPKVEYSLTEVGKKLMPVLEDLGEWGNLVYEQNKTI